jgi:hypothetical protein
VGENILRFAVEHRLSLLQRKLGMFGSRVQQGFSSSRVLQRFNNSLTTIETVLAYCAWCVVLLAAPAETDRLRQREALLLRSQRTLSEHQL